MPRDMNSILRTAAAARRVEQCEGETFSDAIRRTAVGEPASAPDAGPPDIGQGTREPIRVDPPFDRTLRRAVTRTLHGWDPADYQDPDLVTRIKQGERP